MQQGGSCSLGHPLVEWAKHNLACPSMKGEKSYCFFHGAAYMTIMVGDR